MKPGQDIVRDIQTALSLYGADISAELRTIERERTPIERARLSIIFAMVSPRLAFAKNAAATPVLYDAIMAGKSATSLEWILRTAGIGMAPTKAERLHAVSDILRNMRHPPERDMLMALRGVGPKVASMATALYDPSAPVITLDVHMLRGLGIDAESLCPKAYMGLESALLAILAKHFPDVRPFVVQWALWTHYGFQRHMSHLPIFGLSPKE